MVQRSLLRAFAVGLMLFVAMDLIDPRPMAWHPLGAVVLLIVLSHLLLLDLPPVSFPPLGKGMESFIATLSVLTMTLHRLIPLFSPHSLLVLTVLMALAMGFFEWFIEEKFRLPVVK